MSKYSFRRALSWVLGRVDITNTHGLSYDLSYLINIAALTALCTITIKRDYAILGLRHIRTSLLDLFYHRCFGPQDSKSIALLFLSFFLFFSFLVFFSFFLFSFLLFFFLNELLEIELESEDELRSSLSSTPVLARASS